MSASRRDRIATLLKILEVLGEVPKLRDFDFRLKAQKIVYIAQHLGINLGYRFVWYTYGPYSRALAQDLARLDGAHLRGSDTEEVGKLIEQLKRLCDRLKLLSAKRGRGLSYWLELAASLLMLERDVYPKPSDPVAELVRLKRVNESDVRAVRAVLKRLNVLN